MNFLLSSIFKHSSFCALISLVFASGTFAADVTVLDRSALVDAIEVASPGDTILLAPGDYGTLTVNDKNFAPALTLRAADKSNPPRFTSVKALNGSGLHFDGFRVAYGATAAPLTTYAVEINGVDDFVFAGSEIYSAQDDVRTNDGYGIFVRNSDNVLIEQNFIHDVFRGVAIFEVGEGIVRENLITKAGSDGIVGRGLVNVTIEANIMKDFNVIDPVAHHPDGIQIWSREALRRTQNVSIIRNVVLRGIGDPFQGILIGTNELPADGLTIENNVIHQSMPQGIYVGRAKNIVLNNNTVTAFDWENDRPGIEIRSPAGAATANNNIARAYRLASSVVQNNNVEINFYNPWIETYADSLMASPFEGVDAVPGDFRRRTNYGANGFIEAIEAFPEVSDISIQHVRQAQHLLDGIDVAIASASSANWAFYEAGNGTQTFATGINASHQFMTSGVGAVEVSANTDGQTHQSGKKIRVHAAEIIDFTFENGIVDAAGEAINFSGDAASYGSEGGIGFASFNGLKPKDGGEIFTSDVSPKASSANDLSIEARVRRPVSTGWQILAVVPSAYEVRFNGNHVRLSVWNADGVVKRVTAYNTGIADRNWHDVRLQYTAGTGLIEIIIDGIVKAQGNGPGGRIAYQPGQRLYVGGSPWIASFKGDVERLTIRR